MAKSFTAKSHDGIEWHVEQQGSGPNLILVPSGEGDCSSFSKIVSILSQTFTVTTFDMPGFSRSVAPPSAFETLNTRYPLSRQIVGLMDELSIKSAHVYGCSSGGSAVLGLVADHPTRVLSAIVHEVPLAAIGQLQALSQLDDAGVVQACKHTYSTVLCEDQAAWDDLGEEYHARLEKNYVTWVREYVGRIRMQKLTDAELKHRPITWTVGALSPTGFFFENVITAVQADIPISLLPCKHFPQVTIPEILAGHIRDSALKMSARRC